MQRESPSGDFLLISIIDTIPKLKYTDLSSKRDSMTKTSQDASNRVTLHNRHSGFIMKKLTSRLTLIIIIAMMGFLIYDKAQAQPVSIIYQVKIQK